MSKVQMSNTSVTWLTNWMSTDRGIGLVQRARAPSESTQFGNHKRILTLQNHVSSASGKCGTVSLTLDFS